MARDGWGADQSATGWGKTGRNSTDRGTSGTRRSVLAEGAGIPVGLVVAGANRNDCTLAQATLESIPIARPTPIAAQLQGVCLDKGYDYPEV